MYYNRVDIRSSQTSDSIANFEPITFYKLFYIYKTIYRVNYYAYIYISLITYICFIRFRDTFLRGTLVFLLIV